jgi:hypothetical protein
MPISDDRVTVFEEVLAQILNSWTALELAVTHFDGQFRDAQHNKQQLLESLCDAIVEDKYSQEDIAGYVNDYMFDHFHMELDDDSQFEVAKASMDAWTICRTGARPHIARRPNGANCSIVKEEVDEVDEDEDMGDDSPRDPSSSTQRQPKVVTDEEGWSTVMHG